MRKLELPDVAVLAEAFPDLNSAVERIDRTYPGDAMVANASSFLEDGASGSHNATARSLQQSYASVLYLAGARPGMRYYELDGGPGMAKRVVFAGMMGLRATGVEPESRSFEESCTKLTKSNGRRGRFEQGLPKMDLVKADAEEVDCRDADVVMLRSGSSPHTRKIIANARPSTTVISHHPLAGVEPVGWTTTGRQRWYIHRARAGAGGDPLAVAGPEQARSTLRALPMMPPCQGQESGPCYCGRGVGGGVYHDEMLPPPSDDMVRLRFPAHDQALRKLDNVYEGLSEDAYAMDGPEITEAREEMQRLVGSGEAATYGEILPHSVSKMLFMAGAQPGMRYYDLGSGFGKTVALASLLGLKATGVELEKVRFQKACHYKDRAEQLKVPFAQLVNSKLENVDFRDADVVFADSLLMPKSTLHSMADIAAGMRPGSILVTSRRLEDAPALQHLGDANLKTSWSSASTFSFQRVLPRTVLSAATQPARLSLHHPYALPGCPSEEAADGGHVVGRAAGRAGGMS